ncbi:hypothetical protein BRADI_2g14656v3, partial [Brachypodium distachyon]
ATCWASSAYLGPTLSSCIFFFPRGTASSDSSLLAATAPLPRRLLTLFSTAVSPVRAVGSRLPGAVEPRDFPLGLLRPRDFPGCPWFRREAVWCWFSTLSHSCISNVVRSCRPLLAVWLQVHPIHKILITELSKS